MFNATLRGFLKKEFVQTLRDPKMRVVVFVLPIIQMTMFGMALSNEVKNIRLGAHFAPHDLLSREIAERAVSSGWFVPAAGEDPDAVHWIQSGRADVVLVAPPGGLRESLERGNGRLQLLVDATNVMRAQAVENYLQGIVNQVVTNSMQQSALPALRFDIRILYNPTMETSAFMVPGVMSMILCIVTILLTSMALAREKEVGTFETLIAAPVKTWEILLGKTLPYVVLGMADVPLIIGVAVLGFGVPLKGSLAVLLVAGFIFVCTTVGIGVLISTISRTQQQAMMGGFIFLFPAVLFSGIMFPVENMPQAMKILAYINPLKYFAELVRNIMLKGGDSGVIVLNLGVLVVMAATALALSFKRFKHTL